MPSNFHNFVVCTVAPGAPLTYFNDRGGGGGGLSDFFGSEILAKSDFLGFMKDAGIFLGRKKKPGIFLGCEKNRHFFGCKKKAKGFFWVC